MPWNTLCGFPPTKEKVRLMVPNKAWRPDTVITDIDGNEMYVLLDQENKMRSYQAVFGDLEGRRLACVKRHVTKAFWKDGYYFCTYRPNYAHQRPLKDRDMDNKKIYPFSYLEVEPMKGRFYYKYIDDDQQLGPPRLYAENPWLGFMMVCCSPLLRCSRFSTRFKRGGSRKTHVHVDQWRNIVSVKPGSDLLAALCMAYVFDKHQAQPMVTVVGRDEDDEYEDSDESLDSIDSDDDDYYYSDDDDNKDGDYDSDNDDDANSKGTKRKKKVAFEIDGNPEDTHDEHEHEQNHHNRHHGNTDQDNLWASTNPVSRSQRPQEHDASYRGPQWDNDNDNGSDRDHGEEDNFVNYNDTDSNKAATVYSAASTLANMPQVNPEDSRSVYDADQSQSQQSSMFAPQPPLSSTSTTMTPEDEFFAAHAPPPAPRDPDANTVTSGRSRVSARSNFSSSSRRPAAAAEQQQQPQDVLSMDGGGRSVASARSRQSAASRSTSGGDPFGQQLEPSEIV